MSTMLNFYEAAWTNARELAMAGRHRPALAGLEPILGSPTAPAHLKLLAYRLAARIEAQRERYRASRRHLYAAEKLEPSNAEIHFEIGTAFERDPYGCDSRAARRFRRAVKLAPTVELYRAHLGRALVRIDRVRAGLRYLRAFTTIESVAVLEIVVDGLNDAGRPNLAEQLVRMARFLKLNDAKTRELTNEVRFAAALRQQKQTNRVARIGTGPLVLPFLRVAGTGRVIRHDSASTARPHVGRLRAYRSERG